MTEIAGKIRLFVRAPLAGSCDIPLTPDQAHYLLTVMRQESGARITVFNGRDGAWLAELQRTGKRAGLLRPLHQSAPQRAAPDLTLLFAPIKKARTDFIVEKATELGVARIGPVFTRRTNAERLRSERLEAHMIEAAEQCGETFVPELLPACKLDAALAEWDPDRRLIFCDEARQARPIQAVLNDAAPGPWAILIGPEGGFDPQEAERLRALPFVRPVSLGPRVLRADTAAIAALSVWHATRGDWR